jgi:hypothetical protein
MYTRKAYATREAPRRGQSDDQPDAREGQAGRLGVAEGFVVPLKLGNSSGGKGPQFKTDAIRGEGPGRLGNLSTPQRVQKPQMALHAKAQAWSLVREPDAGNLPVRFDERDVETESRSNH